jgi:phosphoadenosine phosphosulfate reductase
MRAIERLRAFEPWNFALVRNGLHEFARRGFYGAFSGGKDSVVLYYLARAAGVQVDWHYNLTTVDPPELVRFIRSNFPDVAIERPKCTFWQLMRAKGGLPTMHRRWCCEVLKERGGIGRKVITGVRAEESNTRAKYGIVQPCMKSAMRGKILIHPILDWTNEDVWKYIHTLRLPYCSLYDEGLKRIGCVLCPFERRPREAEARWPKLFGHAYKVVEELYATQEEWQRAFPEGPRGVWDWWMDRRRAWPREEGDQSVLPFDQFDDGEA